jgi:two-component system sensor histidine kinase TctE
VSSSISRQLVLWLAVPLMLLALCGALVHYFNTVAPGVVSSDKRLKSAANALTSRLQVHEGVVTLAPAAADALLYAVRDSQGRLVAGSEKLPAVTLNSATPQMFAMLQVDRHAVRSLTTRMDTQAGGVVVTVADMQPVAEPAARYGFVSTLLWDFVQLDVTLVLVWVGIQLGLRPLKRLRDDIAARSPQDLRPIEETAAPREIAPVVVTLNRLFNTLRTSAQSQQQFIANTAHQLRTPITGLQAQLDLLLAEPAALPVSHRLRTLQEGIKQLAHASNQLLTLARADPSVNLATKKRDVRLDATVAEVAARYFDHALRSNIDLGIDTQPVTVLADPALLDDLLSNLVDNALKYTPPGGSVTLRAGEQHGRPVLEVEDTGPGIPEAERQRVRQRFYRLPNSPGHGSGLGLAIVDEIARLHDATLTIGGGGGTDGGGTTVTVRFG